MLVSRFLQSAFVVLALLWDWRCEAATAAIKICGRDLSDIMSRVCHVYNSPPWDVPTVVEQPAAIVRRRRRTGIADECCIYGCTWEQLSAYCAISAKSESPLDSMEAHMIADRSAESSVASPGVADTDRGREETGARREVGRGRSRGYGRGRAGRRCWCRRKRRSGRRRSSLMGAHKKCRARCASTGHSITPTNLGQDSQH